MKPLAHLISPRPWAILETHPAWAMIRGLAAGTIAVDLDRDAFAARAAAATYRERIGAQKAGTLQIIPVTGCITQHWSWMTWILDGTALDWLREAIAEAIADPEVGAILLDVDSPGGSVDGLTEFATWLRAARERGGKPIVAISDPMMASAALWTMSQASEVVLTPSGEAGSVGIVAMHVDMSAALELDGLKVTLISSGQYKTEANPYEPLPEEARARLQVESEHYYGQFLGDLEAGRGVARAVILEQFGQGRMLMPAEAKAAGMIDRIASFEDTVARLSKVRPTTTGQRRAEDEHPEPAAGEPPDAPAPAAEAPAPEPQAADAAPESPPQPDPSWVRANAAKFDRAAHGTAPRWYD